MKPQQLCASEQTEPAMHRASRGGNLSRSSSLQRWMLLFVFSACGACDTGPAVKGGQPSGRFAAVGQVNRQGAQASSSFCEITYPAVEASARRFTTPQERPLPQAVASPSRVAAGAGPSWKWVNLWATWCRPCVEEMALLGRWQEALARDGIGVDFEMWSIDDDAAAIGSYLSKNRVPGRVHWMASPDALTSTLDMFGVDKGSAIPIHALVDPRGNLRCVRVGAVHQEDYGAIKSMLTGG